MCFSCWGIAPETCSSPDPLAAVQAATTSLQTEGARRARGGCVTMGTREHPRIGVGRETATWADRVAPFGTAREVPRPDSDPGRLNATEGHSVLRAVRGPGPRSGWSLARALLPFRFSFPFWKVVSFIWRKESYFVCLPFCPIGSVSLENPD